MTPAQGPPAHEPAAGSGQDLPAEVRRFMDERGRFKQWPAKRKVQLLALAHLASRLEPGRRYSEREVNDLLHDHHTFNDAAMLRRALFDHGFVDRRRDGSAYWRIPRERPGG